MVNNLRYGWVGRVLRRLLAPVLVRQEAALGQVAQDIRALREQVAAWVRRMEGARSELDARQDDLTRVQERLAAELAGQTRRQDEIVRVQERLAEEIRSIIQRHEDLLALQRNVERELEGVKAAQKMIAAAQEQLVAEVREVEQGHRALVQVQEDFAIRVGRVEQGHEALVKIQAGLQEEIVGTIKRGDALVRVQEVLREQVDKLWGELGRMEQGLVSGVAQIDNLTTRMVNSEGTCIELQKRVERVAEETNVLKGMVGGALERLVEKPSRHALETSREALAALDDLAYMRFEDDHRGSEEEIRGRLRWYLPWLRGVETTPESYVLDVGCGRGEFVALLLDEGFHARGVDVNQVLVERARGKGLPVERADLFDVLVKGRKETLAGISAFHVLEHLPANMQVRFLRLAFAALRPGGVLMLEFPNILSLRVAATDFHKDPTHLRPLHPVTVEGWLREMGFEKIHVEFLHPYPKEEFGGAHGELSEGVRMLVDVVFGNRDCAVIAVKGKTTEPHEVAR